MSPSTPIVRPTVSRAHHSASHAPCRGRVGSCDDHRRSSSCRSRSTAVTLIVMVFFPSFEPELESVFYVRVCVNDCGSRSSSSYDEGDAFDS